MQDKFNLKKISRIFGSKQKAQEILLLLRDIKPVVRQGFYPHELLEVKKFCKEHNISIEKSRFKILLDDINNGYSNKGVKIPEDDPRDGMYFVYLSKDKIKSYKAAIFESSGNDVELGLLLGYPTCCINYYINYFSENNTNPEHSPTNPYTNTTKRHEDHSIISHFPCSPDCEKSIAMGKEYLNTIDQFDHERAVQLLNTLK